MRSLRSWLIASHLIPLFVIIPVVGFIIISLLNSRLVLNQLSTELANQAALIAEVANTQPGVWQDREVADRYLLAISQGHHWDIMILDAEGHLLATSNPNYASEVGNYISDVPEITQLQSGQQAIFVGMSDRTQSRVADVAVPATNAQNQVVGIVRVTTELDTLNQNFVELQRVVIAIVAFALLVGLGIALLLALAIERPLRQLTVALHGIGQGQPLTVLLPEQGPREIQQLAQTFNLLTERLARLEETRRRGYAVRDALFGGSFEEMAGFDDGFDAIAVPILADDGVRAAINLVWPRRYDLRAKVVEAHLGDLQACAAAIAAALASPRRP